MTKYKKVSPKYRHELNKKDSIIIDESEIADIDRDEQEAGMKRRERRWKEIQLELKQQQELRDQAIKKAEQHSINRRRNPTPLERAWLQCDYILFNIMERDSYEFMDSLRTTDPETYKKMYRVFISPYMMENAQFFVNYFAMGNEVPKKVPFADMYKEYKKIKGLETDIKIVHKGKKERRLGEEEEDDSS